MLLPCPGLKGPCLGFGPHPDSSGHGGVGGGPQSESAPARAQITESSLGISGV